MIRCPVVSCAPTVRHKTTKDISGLMILIDIGCGENKIDEDAIGVDVRKTSHINVMANGSNLPFRDAIVDRVYSSHMIEHMGPRKDVEKALREWVRVLREEGYMEIRCPDLWARALLFVLRPSWYSVGFIYGNRGTHRCGFSYGLLKEMLHQCGMADVRRRRDWKGLIPYRDLHVLAKKR